jgi:hypothetical protein
VGAELTWRPSEGWPHSTMHHGVPNVFAVLEMGVGPLFEFYKVSSDTSIHISLSMLQRNNTE